MDRKPKLQEIRQAKDTLKRWHAAAKAKNKASAMYKTKRIYELLQYLEEIVDFDIH